MTPVHPFASVARLPAPGDNVAMAVRRLEAGLLVEMDGVVRALPHTVLEGHRFAVRAIAPGEALLSWGLPFGHALARILAGDYLCNASILEALAARRLDIRLPDRPNFADHLARFCFDETGFRAAAPVVPVPPAERRTFAGFRRAGRRGVGTRNVVVVLGTTSRTASFARQLAARLQPLARRHPQIDGIVAVAHTEGGGVAEPNNADEMLRALAGFMAHPNVGAVLAVDYGVEPVTNLRLQAFMRERGYPLDDVPHAFLSITRGLAAALAEGEEVIRAWLPEVAAASRTPEPLGELRVALQCGGSDAFSGVSGNPLAGRLVHEVVRQGGIGVLCETDEVVGAESYLVQNMRDLGTARTLFAMIERTRERLAWHGVTFEGNPSGGNKLRGLYNITLKSLGAVHKKDPRTRIDHVIEYAEPLGPPGFYFMDSPGNDLEAIAGEIGAGCNLVLFITGNGSITNFPFVPTLKITTTTSRHQLLIREMDINAGRYLDGEAMDVVAADALELLIVTASGQRTCGEQAGHAQTSLWRESKQTDGSRLAEIRDRAVPDGRPLVSSPRRLAGSSSSAPPLRLFRSGEGWATERVGLVLPTSLCAAQIARLAAERLNAQALAPELGLSRFVALPHSEGCGFGGESVDHLLHRTYRGYATHPNVPAALLLEHGCEKVPNDIMRRQFELAGVPLNRFGWASVQLDGGIDQVLAKIEAWFLAQPATPEASSRLPADLGALTVGLLSAAASGPVAAAACARAAAHVLHAGGTVLMPEGDPLLAVEEFRRRLLGATLPRATLAHGQVFAEPGLHLVATDSAHWVENLAALGACGTHVFLGLVGATSQQGHPLLPVLQIAEPAVLAEGDGSDVDLVLSGDCAQDEDALLRLLLATAQGESVPVATAGGFVDFQLSRGLLGIST